MFKLLFMAALAVSFSASAQQQNAMSLIHTGKYSYSSYGYGGANFTISVAGNSAVLKDPENNIEYSLNTQNTQKQMFPEAFLRMSRARGASAGAASLVRNIGVTQVYASPVRNRRVDGKFIQEGSITGKVIVEIGYLTAFGNIGGTVEMDARVDVTRQNSDIYYQDKDKKWVNREVTSSSLRASAGDFLRLTSFKSNLPTPLNNLAGMLIDIGLRIGSLSLRSTEYLHEIVTP
jgi:hypothetical protein